MGYKIPDEVKEFRSLVPAGLFFILLHERRAHPFLIGRCVRAHRPEDKWSFGYHYETYDAAVEAADKLVTPELLAVVYQAIQEHRLDRHDRPQPYTRFQQWRICDGEERCHSRPTTAERQMIQEASRR